MQLREYQERAQTTALYRESAEHTDARLTQHQRVDLFSLNYAVMKLNGEAGELAEEVAKAMRDDYGLITPDRHKRIIKELGDVLWYTAAVAAEIGVYLDYVALQNLEKLHRRAQEGKIHGAGSDR